MSIKYLNNFDFDSDWVSIKINPNVYIQIIDECFWDLCNEKERFAKLLYIRSNNILKDNSDKNISKVLNMKQSYKKYFFTKDNL